jgi:hypothetical protein
MLSTYDHWLKMKLLVLVDNDDLLNLLHIEILLDDNDILSLI